MKTIAILICLLAVVSLSAAYTQEQQATIDGVTLSFKLGQAYEKAASGQDISAFNDLVDQWNAWVVRNFGNDASLLMEKMTAPLNLQKPYAAALNNTTSTGIIHEMDSRAEYATNDVNLLPSTAIAKYAASETGKATGSEYLGGV
jgi:alpha-L-arabinofuranosidase